MHRAWIALVIGALVTATSCSKPPEADCQLVVGDLLLPLKNIQSGSTLHEVYASPSRISPGDWLISARTDKGIAVWTSTLGPDQDGIPYIFPANEAAHEDSLTGVEMPEQEVVEVPGTKARHDTAGIRVAEACVPPET